MRHRLHFPYGISRADIRIPLRDSTMLYARVWRPHTEDTVPALLEYASDRLTDSTASRDWQRHPWYAGHGYASVRVDARGHGNSEGLPGGQESDDALEVLDWLAARAWCTGRIGMFGLGPGGGLALRVAALAPEPLRAVVAVCAGNDPYDGGGGSLPAESVRTASAALLSAVCRPPDPLYAGAGWRELWLKRLAAVDPGRHPGWGPEPDLADVRVPVLAVGGWYDPYRDTVLRLLERAPGRVRGLIGPWSHQYPDHGRPGPPIGFLQETLRWWDCHLNGASPSTGPSTGPATDPATDPTAVAPLRAWLPDGVAVRGEPHVPPVPHPPHSSTAPTAPGAPGAPGVPESANGRWTAEPAWPSPHITPLSYELTGAPLIVDSPQQTGLEAGPFRSPGHPGCSTDQRADDAYAACFEFPVPGEPIEILGNPRVTLRLRLDVPRGQVAARLCDIAPDGASALVTRGLFPVSGWTPGATAEVTFDLMAIAHTFRRGHRVRLAVSSAYWPWLRPDAGSAGFSLLPEGSRLELPVHRGTGRGPDFEPPEQYEPLGVSAPATFDEQPPERLLVRDIAEDEWRLETTPHPGVTQLHPDGLEITEEAREIFTVRAGDPRSAWSRATWTVRLHRPDLPWDVTVETRSSVVSDGEDGTVTQDEVVCREGAEIVFHRTWEKRTPAPTG